MSESMFPVPEEVDSLASLEDRISRAIQLVARLRKEKEAALADAAAAKAEAARLDEEVRTLQADRKQVRGRIERLLEQIDELNAG
ncbi:MAG TPA: cell division protein ZapB [Bryobacteraceae bacterium]|nr:cell division protein ZapB [Bryobacteraceae bacterium]